jgi:hypothetical protein
MAESFLTAQRLPTRWADAGDSYVGPYGITERRGEGGRYL